MIEIDARGLSCPIPVVRTRQAMKDDPKSELSVLVDEMTQVENITRLGRSNGYQVQVQQADDAYKLILKPI
ncbi:MAG: sulfurtransferase TusA family protein [Candidatus Alcyoniella australis]|nr:sulfurtransferase TusA family protein [Candidatus Alcyoniella australis]